MSVDSINENFLPVKCSTGSGNTYCKLVKVAESSDEYSKCRNIMMKDFVKNFIAVYRVENDYLEKQYLLHLAAKQTNFTGVHERELLHCTAKSNVRSIIEHNFDPERAERVKYGRGVSFSPHAAYANLQSSAGDGIRAMFICKIIIGKTQTGHQNSVLVDPFDTMVSSGDNVYVKTNKYEYYPTHVMYYTSYPVVSYHGLRSVRKN